MGSSFDQGDVFVNEYELAVLIIDLVLVHHSTDLLVIRLDFDDLSTNGDRVVDEYWFDEPDVVVAVREPLPRPVEPVGSAMA